MFTFDCSTFVGNVSLLGLFIAFIVVAALAAKYGHFKGCKRSYVRNHDLTDKDHMYCKKLDQLDHDMGEARKEKKKHIDLTFLLAKLCQVVRTGVVLTEEQITDFKMLCKDLGYGDNINNTQVDVLTAVRVARNYGEMTKLDVEVAISEMLRKAKFVREGNGQVVTGVELISNQKNDGYTTKGNGEDKRTVEIQVSVTS